MEDSVIIKDLRKTFYLSKKQQRLEKTKEKRRIALSGLSFTARRGETFGLLGPNGAGKTTTLRIMSTLIPADSGTVNVEGLDVVKDSEDVRRKIGFLTSELKLEEQFTPNYIFDFFGRLYDLDEREISSRKSALFGKFGIDKYAEVKVGDLSSGMRQKVSLVMSIVHDPELIIFDEPTNGLDLIAAKVVTDYLKDLKSQGKTIILSTHIFDLAEKLCDRVGIIIEGRMELCDTLPAMIREKPLEEVFFDLYARTAREQI